MITSLISRLDFREWAVPAGQFIITANAAIISRRGGICKTLIAELVLNNNVTYTHRPVDSKTGKPSTTAAVDGCRSHNRTRY